LLFLSSLMDTDVKNYDKIVLTKIPERCHCRNDIHKSWLAGDNDSKEEYKERFSLPEDSIFQIII
jgi:hypothetical protein